MSESNDNSALAYNIYDYDPTDSCCLSFEIKWKNARCISTEENYIPGHGPAMLVGHFLPPRRQWHNIKDILKGKYSGEIRVTYFDSEGDEIPVETQCECEELFKYCHRQRSGVRLIVEMCDTAIASKKNVQETENIEIDSSLCPEETASPLLQSQSSTAPLEFNKKTAAAPQLDDDGTQLEETGPPKWFTNYMQTIKREIVMEVTERVTKNVLEALNKNRQSPYDSASSHAGSSDSEFFLESDADERATSVQQVRLDSSTENHKNKAKDSSGSSAHSIVLPRRYRRGEKQHKMRSKDHASKRIAYGFRDSQSFKLDRDEQTARNKRDVPEPRASSQDFEKLALNSVPQVERACRIDEKKCDHTPHERIITTAVAEASFLPLNCTESLESPIVMLANPYYGQQDESKGTDGTLRMGCSVTGIDLLERPNGKAHEYGALSDSDNISIISDVSHSSDMQQMYNSFEIVHQESATFTEVTGKHCSEKDSSEFEQAIPQGGDDNDTTRNSSSFELLSEPPVSPAFSIYTDGESSLLGENATSDYNMNNETTIDKQGKLSKIDKCPYAIDAHGKIYHRNVGDGTETSEILLEKRTGGDYSFIGEALPVSTKEKAIIVDSFDSSTDKTFTTAAGTSNDIPSADNTKKTPVDFQASDNSGHVFYESTHSFHSHLDQQSGDDRQDFAKHRVNVECKKHTTDESCSYGFDYKAHKDTGETKQSMPREQPRVNKKKPSEGFGSEQPRCTRKSSDHSHGSGNRFSGSQSDRTRSFGNWTTTRSSRIIDDAVLNAVDPMHILPEVFVSGAVHVASSAYTTARKVYDKILTGQMGKSTFRSQSNFGRR